MHHFLPHTSNNFADSNIVVHLPKGVLYDTLNFKYNVSKTKLTTYSYLHQVHEPTTPLHKNISISIKPIVDTKKINTSKLLLARYVNGRIRDAGGKYENGYVVTRTREFGQYMIVSDTKAPVIKVLGSMKPVKRPKTIKFKVVDNLSGIGSYNAYINDNWVLLQYDPKRDLMFYQLDSYCPEEEATLLIKVKDDKGNQSSSKVVIPPKQ